ncbi:(Fe-S)-binding protein [Pseudodesulfovibrio tunisiensis]|uniref:(Fe-S)-binding protein n=1 Tax=Pseudodesulfovibrio tunisiensis TaxID=463192 RepID=UPI001FB21DAB|nr:(Fe-S)-binding protein [Pseudodesulfovibrio tunisiensis]
MTNKCVLCGKCLEVCPLLRTTAREELSPRAKADLAALLDDPAELSREAVSRLAGLCLGCGRCREKCPQDVDVPGLVAGLRAAHPGFRSKVWKEWLSRARTLWPLAGKGAPLVPESLFPERFGNLLRLAAGMRADAALAPCVQVRTWPATCRGEALLLFAGCMAEHVRPEWRKTAEAVLEGLGASVIPAEFSCCGSGLDCAGFADDAESLARINVEVWRKAGKPRIAVFCASCLDHLRRYVSVFDSPEEEGEWRDSLVALSSLLDGAEFALLPGAPGRVGYHHPCHMHGVDPDAALMSAMFGPALVAATKRECCGFGGIMQLCAPELSATVNRECLHHLEGADIVLTGCSACVMQLAATVPENVRAGHWLEALSV